MSGCQGASANYGRRGIGLPQMSPSWGVRLRLSGSTHRLANVCQAVRGRRCSSPWCRCSVILRGPSGKCALVRPRQCPVASSAPWPAVPRPAMELPTAPLQPHCSQPGPCALLRLPGRPKSLQTRPRAAAPSRRSLLQSPMAARAPGIMNFSCAYRVMQGAWREADSPLMCFSVAAKRRGFVFVF